MRHQSPPGSCRRPGRTRRREGTFLIITVAGLFMFMGLVALVADFGYTFAERQRIQGVLDMAGMTTLLTVDPIDNSSGLASVQEILTQNAVNPSIVTSVAVVIEGRGVNLTIDATIPVDALFGNVYGFTQYSAAVTSKTTATRATLPQPLLNGFGLFGCTSLTVNKDMGSYDSAIGDDEGPPIGFPAITSCTAGTNCGDELLVGSNGDVIFEGSTVYGNVVAGGNISVGGGSPNRLSGDARAGGTITGVTVGGTSYENQPFTPIDCTEDGNFPGHFLENTAEPATHTHGANTYSRKRHIETDAVGNDVNGDGETDGVGDVGSVVDGFTINYSGISAIAVFGNTREYTMGNRTLAAVPSNNGHAAADSDILFHANTEGGNEYPGTMAGTYQYPMVAASATETGGWLWTPDTSDTAIFRTGIAYFFHGVELAGNKTHSVVGDWEVDGPAVWFIHGNGQDTGGIDLKSQNAEMTYDGLCGGMSCGGNVAVPGLRVYATDRSYLRFRGNFHMAIDVIAPGALVDLSGTSGVMGRVLADVVDMSGTSVFSFDTQLLEGDVDQPFIPEKAELARIVY